MSNKTSDNPPQLPATITATELKRKSGEIMRRASQNNEHFIVERDGYPVVALIPLKYYLEKSD